MQSLKSEPYNFPWLYFLPPQIKWTSVKYVRRSCLFIICHLLFLNETWNSFPAYRSTLSASVTLKCIDTCAQKQLLVIWINVCNIVWACTEHNSDSGERKKKTPVGTDLRRSKVSEPSVVVEFTLHVSAWHTLSKVSQTQHNQRYHFNKPDLSVSWFE